MFSLFRYSILTLVVWFATSTNATASEYKYVVGLSAGSTQIVEDEPISPFILPGQHLDDRVDSKSFYFGFQLYEKLSLELGHSKMSTAFKFHELRTDIIPSIAPRQYEYLDISQTYVGVVATSSFRKNFALIGLVGYSVFHAERFFSNLGGSSTYTDNPTEDAVYFGFGLKYKLTSQLIARVQWTTGDAADFRTTQTRMGLEFLF